MFRTTLIAAAFALAPALSATAGGLSEPVMEPEVIVQEIAPSTDGSGFLQWVLLATLLVAVAAN